MFLLWAITLTGGFWAARGLISARAHRKEIIVRASFTGSGELALYLTSGFILAYAWFQLLSALIAPWFLPHPSGFTSPSQSQYDALIRLPVFFNLLWFNLVELIPLMKGITTYKGCQIQGLFIRLN